LSVAIAVHELVAGAEKSWQKEKLKKRLRGLQYNKTDMAKNTGPKDKTVSIDQERSELHRTIWNAATELVHGGSVSAVDFKQYMFGALFYRFISENITNSINNNEHRAGNKDFDYAKLADKEAEYGREGVILEKGFYILPSELFVNVRAGAKDDANLNETLERIFRNIERSAKGKPSEDDLKGLFEDFNVNSNQLGASVDRRNKLLAKLLDTVGDLRLGTYSDHSIDLFGDAYEYLMGMYATAAGKKGGEFYTPQEVSELLAEITTVGKKEVNKVYDPACGSGSLLLKFAKVLGKDNVRKGFYGQEINLTTYNLCRINMFLHNINYEKFNITHGDTLADPKHWDEEPFDAIVSNPPYSIPWEGDANPLLINDPRFSPAGVLAPKSKADLAFTMHMLSWLSTSGTAAIVEFPGVLYRGGAEQKIRKYLVDNNYVDAIIQLPPDLFFGTTISTCIVVLKKSKKDNKTLFIDASTEFKRVGNKNKLSDEKRKKILDAYIARTDSEYFATVADTKAIAENDYNLSVSSYVAQKDTREVVDIDTLNADIKEIVKRQSELRTAIDAIVADIEGK
jgi:type I restriction enzyme M protein